MRDRPSTKAWITLAAVATLAASLLAQRQFDELRKRGLPADADITLAATLGDVDGDSDLDLVFGNWGRRNRLYVNDGTGIFTDVTGARMPADSDVSRALAMGDVDRDGDLDMVFGNGATSAQQNRLYLNDGSGRFADVTAVRMPPDNDFTGAVALGDVDGDGDLDMVFGNGAPSTPRNRLYLNDGTGTFTDVTSTRMPADSDNTAAVTLGDVDGDGDLDMVLGNDSAFTGPNRLYLNDGTGTFIDATSARMPADSDRTSAVALGDVDGDGDLDMVFGNRGQRNRLYLNDGSGTYADVTASRMPAFVGDTCAVELGDVDGDGDRDLVVGNSSGHNRLHLNDGTGTFTDATGARMTADDDLTQAVALGDVDGDGDLDVVFGNGGSSTRQNRLHLNDGRGAFTDATSGRIPAGHDQTSAIALGDVDGDRDLDLVVGNHGQNRLHLNDGTGKLTDVTGARMPPDTDQTSAIALGDVDGDGDLDAFVGNGGSCGMFVCLGQRNRLYLNDGTGNFTDVTIARTPAQNDVTLAVALGDVDGDGDLDAVMGNTGSFTRQNRLYLNDGSGTFTDATSTRMPPDNDTTAAVALGDVDGDGDLDVVLGNTGTSVPQDRLYLNDGTGTFTDVTAARMPPDTRQTRSVALGDVDGDGDLDIVFGNYGTFAQPNRLYLNDGTGTFSNATLARMPTLGDDTRAVALGDVDDDGDLDIVLGNSGQNRIQLNDGTGNFTDVTDSRMPVHLDATLAVATGDVDGDGDLDMVFGNGTAIGPQANVIYLNLLRQLDSPLLVRPGHSYRLDVFARYGPPRLVDVALPYVSPATARIPLPPYGTLRLDPAFLIPLQPFVVPPQAGSGTVTVPIPNIPGLVGLSLHAQALLLQWPRPALLTNATSDRIVQ